MGTSKRAGGEYEVSGVMVDADGHPIKGNSVDMETTISPPVPSADGVGMEGTDGDTDEERSGRKASSSNGSGEKSGAKQRR